MSPDEYAAEVARIITSNFRGDESSGGMPAARAGWLVHEALHVDPAAVGYARFSDVLRDLERKRIIRLDTSAKGQIIVLPPALAAPAGTGTSDTSPSNFRRLRNAVWLAFIAESPVGRRYIHTRTGEVRRGVDAPPSPSDEWVEVAPLAPDAQRADANAFLRAEGHDGDTRLRDALASPNWSRIFSTALHSVDPIIATKWKRRRTERVIAHAEQWRKVAGVPADLLYEPTPARQLPDVAVQPAATEARLRDAIISAVRQLSTDELLDLRLSVRSMVSSLRPDLLVR